MAADFFEESWKITDPTHRLRDRMVLIFKFGLPAPTITLLKIIGCKAAGSLCPVSGKIARHREDFSTTPAKIQSDAPNQPCRDKPKPTGQATERRKS